MGRDHGSSRRALGSFTLACFAVLACALGAAPQASAYTYVLRPDTTLQTGAWNAIPGSNAVHEVLDDAVLQPAAPSVLTDYIQANGNGPITSEVGYGTVTLRGGENVVRARSRGYLATGDSRWIESELRTGATLLASGTQPANTPAAWQTIESLAPLTQAEVDGLQSTARLEGSGASTASTVYAGYVELTTDQPPPTPAVTAGQAAFGQGTSPSWSFSATPAAGFECKLERPGQTVSDWSSCTSARTYDLTLGNQPDAQYTFSVRAVDDLGVAGTAATSTYTLDRSAPLAPAIDASPTTPAPASSAEWSFTPEAGALTSCRLTRGAAVISDWDLCSSPASFTGLTDGTYTFEVHATDMAGNVGPNAVRTYTRDSVKPPAPAVTAAQGASGNLPNVSWSFTAEAGAAVTCRLERNGTVVPGLDWGSCSGTRAYDLSGPGDGAYTFRVRATDGAGNVSDEGTGTYLFDTVLPAAPNVTSGPTGHSNTLSPSYGFTTDAGTTTECRIENSNGGVISNWTACVSPRSYALGVQSDGVITFRVRATDGAGNVGPEGTRAYTLDQTAPTTPVITGGPAASSSDPATAFEFTVEATTSPSCQMEREGVVIIAWEPCASPKGYDLASRSDGTFTFRVRSADAAGNTSLVASRTFELDRVAPNQPTIVSRPGTQTNNPSPTWTFTSDSTSTFFCRVDDGGSTVVSDWATCTSPRSVNLAGHPDGVYTFRVRASDPAGNASNIATDTFSLDRSPPVAPTISAGPTGFSRVDEPSYAFTGEGGAAITCRFERPGTVLSDWGPCVSPRTFDLRLQPDSAYTFSVRATDPAGNPGAIATRSYTLDRTAPAPPVLTGPAGDSNDDTPVWSFTGEVGTSAECALDRGATTIQAFAPCSSPVGYNLTGDVDATYTVRVRITDAAGNTSTEGTRTYTLDRVKPPPPILSSRPGNDTNAATLTWTYTTTGATATSCRLERGATVVSDWTACTSPRSYASQPEGSYTFRIRANDAAGNVGDETVDGTVVDRTVPATPTITGGPPASSSDAGPAFTFTSESGSAPACRVERGAAVVSDWGPCTSPRSYDISAEVDGQYTFRVRTADLAGNTSGVASRAFELDRVAPPAPTLTARPAANTNNASASWSFTAADASTFRCRLERGATLVSDWGTCTSPRTYDLTSQSDGVYTFRVRASDIAANESTETTDTFALDRVAPVVPSISAGPTGPSRVDEPSYAFTAEGGSALTCRIERPGTVVSDWGPCVSPRSYDLRLHPDAAYTFSVRATDAAGNVSPTGTRSYTLDRTPPAAPVLAGTSGESNDDTPTWTFTGEIGTAAECALDRETTTIRAFAPCSTPVGYVLTSESDATYTVRVRITDAAGNTSAESTRTYNLDRVEPPPPILTARPGNDTNAPTLTWSYTTTGATGTSCRLERGTTVVSDWAACTSPRSYASLPEGSYIFRVRASDDAGNVGDETADGTDVDRTAPALPAISDGPAADSSDATPTFTFTGEAGASPACRLERGSTPISDWSPCASPRTYDIGTEVDGGYTFRVRVTDAAGNTSGQATRSYTLDRAAPPAPTLTSRPPAATNAANVQWAFDATDAATYRCRLERGAVVSDWAPCTSPQGYDLGNEADGSYTFRVRASDVAANESAETTDDFDLDRQAPAAPSMTSGPTGEQRDQTPSYGFTAEAGSTTACRLERTGTAAPVSDWASCTSPRGYDLSAEVDGEYTFRVRATDAAGNTGAERTRVYTLDRTAPADPSITAGPTGESADDTPTFAWTGEAGVTAECRIQRSGTDVLAWASCTSPETFALGGETDGPLTFGVRITDPAGNTSAISSRGYTLDRAAPDAPAISAGPPADSVDDTPVFSFSAEAGSTLSCRLDRGTTEVEDWTACTSPHSYDLRGESDGTYTFAVRATDASGNTGDPSTRTYTLDRIVPAPPSIDARPGAQGNTRDPEWAFSTTEASRFFECRVTRSGGAVVSAWGPCVSPRSFSLAMQPDDTYTFALRTYNAAGTRSEIVADTYRLDTAAPAAPGISDGPPADSTDARPTWSVTAEPSAELECRLERGTDVVADWAPCTSPAGYDLTSAPDGTYTFSARATDLAANTGAPATSTYTLDRTTPAEPQLGTSAPPAGSATNPQWSFSTPEPGKTFECRVTRGTDVLRDWSACTSPLALDLANEPDGDYEVEIRTINAAGTRSPITSVTYELDRVNPDAPVITDGPPADSSDDTPTYTFTGEADARFACRVERGTDVVRDWSTCASPETQSLSGEPDGTYRFLVHQTDAAGNVSADATRDYTLDRTTPGGPAFTARPQSPAPGRTPTWSFTGDPDRTFECRVVRGGADVRGWAACTSPHSPDLGGEPDGTYALHVRQVNRAGTRGPEATDDYVLDSTAPDAPVITGSPGPTGRLSAPRWTFTAEDGASVECRLQLGGADVRPWGACTSPRDYGLAGEPDGTYTFSVRATDVAGNTGPAATQVHVLDRVAPEPPVITSSPGPLGNSRAPAWAFTAETGAVLECRFDRGTAPMVGWGPCQSPRGFDLSGLPDGPYAFVVRAVDPAGNISNETISGYELDTTPGAVQILSGPGPLGRLRTPEWTFASDGAAAVECRLSMRETPIVEWQPCSTPRGFDLAGQPDGVFRFAARATDAAGNLGPVADTDYQLDTTPPEAPTIEARPESPSEDRSPTWRFSGETGATFSCRVERSPADAIRDWATCASPFTADLLRVADDEYRFLVRATDRAGNVGDSAGGGYTLRKAAPVPPKDEPVEKREDPPAAKDDDAVVPAAPVRKKPQRKRPAVRKAQPKPVARAPKKRRRETAAPPAKPRPKPPARPSAPQKQPARPEAKGNFASRALRNIANVIVEHPDKSVFPMSLIFLVVGFLLVQSRIDRSDPKLALAPVHADPDLEFSPPPEPSYS